MIRVESIGLMLAGFAFVILPALYPLFFLFSIKRKPLFYFVGFACSFACFRLAPVFWGICASLIANLIAFLRHEDSSQAMEYSFQLVMPGGGNSVMMGLLPVILIGSLLSLAVLGILKASLFKSPAML